MMAGNFLSRDCSAETDLKGAVPGSGAEVKVRTGEVLAGVPSPTV